MKKPSKQWKEFLQIIKIVDIRILRKQKELMRLKKKQEEIDFKIENKKTKLEEEQTNLIQLKVLDEHDSVSRLFTRREEIKYKIESTFLDISILKKESEDLKVNINNVIIEKTKLEKRKLSLDEIHKTM